MPSWSTSWARPSSLLLSSPILDSCGAHLIDHLVKQAGTDRGTLAVVDVGFGGQIQALLQTIVDASGLEIRFLGLYLLSFFNSEPHLLAGNQIESYLANLATPADLVGDVFQNTPLLELVLGAPEGSVIEIGPEARRVALRT